jgi:hypothetical protein
MGHGRSAPGLELGAALPAVPDQVRDDDKGHAFPHRVHPRKLMLSTFRLLP